jgi:hypothetical protein
MKSWLDRVNGLIESNLFRAANAGDYKGIEMLHYCTNGCCMQKYSYLHLFGPCLRLKLTYHSLSDDKMHKGVRIQKKKKGVIGTLSQTLLQLMLPQSMFQQSRCHPIYPNQIQNKHKSLKSEDISLHRKLIQHNAGSQSRKSSAPAI